MDDRGHILAFQTVILGRKVMAEIEVQHDERKLSALARARLLATSNYGREFGWYIERDGVVVRELFDCRSGDQFWDWYEVRAASPAMEAITYDDSKWFRVKYRYRNKVLGDYADGAYCGGPPFVQQKLVHMRGLYLSPNNWLESICLLFLGWIEEKPKHGERTV